MYCKYKFLYLQKIYKMIPEDIIIQVIEDQEKSYQKRRIIARDKKINPGTNRVIVVTGVRRSGKSTFLKQINVNNEALFINFEDTRLESFETSDFNKVELIAQKKEKQLIVLDEAQNIPGWEKYARSANDRGVKLQITGSNASMLSRELGPHLTGRYQQIELFPFSFKEFLMFTEQSQDLNSFDNFIEMGGFPEYLAEKDREYLRTLLRDIVIRDIAVRRGIKNENFLIRLAVHILSNIGKEFSYNNITKTLEIRSVRTTIDYCDYLQESYLIELIPRFSYSMHQQLANPKKAYCIDTAMASANSLSFGKDKGRMPENAVFIELRRQFNDICYYNNGRSECDFLVKEAGEVIQAVQVCLKINPDNIVREIKGIKEAMEETKCTKGTIITLDQEDILDGIPLVPAWKWMCREYA